MKYFRWLLFPFSLMYGLIVIIRNFCYDSGIFKSRKFNKSVICVGNLDVGGAGKSPMTEYLIRLLKDDHKLATLSRGYGRETKGFLERRGELVMGSAERRAWIGEAGVENRESRAKNQERETNKQEPVLAQLTTHQLIGDEPSQFKQKFPGITVAVCEDRAAGIKKLSPDHDLIILDDAYQHRAVEAGLSILLFDYNRLNELHLLLPAGNLREPVSGRWRAQLLIVSKCPSTLSNDDRIGLAAKVQPLPYQKLFFTSIIYQGLQDLGGQPSPTSIDKKTAVFLLTGIAGTGPLLKYISGITPNLTHHKYPDHHPFTLKNITKLAVEFARCSASKKIIITTEKDAQRLQEPSLIAALKGLPFFVMPIKVEFLNNDGPRFDQLVKKYVREHTAGSRIS